MLTIEGEPRSGLYSGYTPLVKADRLAKKIGVRELYLKDDSVNHPPFSCKDGVVSVAAPRAVELGFDVFGCASTGNLANSVSAHAARLGLQCYVFIPNDLEPGKILGSGIYCPQVVAIKGNYDDVNRLCTQIAEKYGWGFANINLRSYYAEGAKTYGFEIAEQLGWKFPRHVVSPVAGGTLLPRIARGFREMKEVGLVSGELPAIHAAQAAGCAPVINALAEGLDFPDPVKPNTIARSIAIGNPADGFQVLQAVRSSGGPGAMATDEKILAIADRIKTYLKSSPNLVVAVSAMGKTTDQLVALARQVSANPHGRDYDLLLASGEQVAVATLALALQGKGVPAIALTGAQCNIRTDGSFNRAKIQSIDTARIEEELHKGRVVIVAGFQGVTDNDEVTTLGRGGGDITGAAVAAALNASVCEICTDVDGVLSADPNLVPDAKFWPEITYEEAIEMASSGAKVLHPRAAEICHSYNIPIHVRSSFHLKEGTWIREGAQRMEDAEVVG